MKLHGPVVAVEVGLTFRTVADEGVDLADAALELECGGEHCAAHADNAGLAESGENCFGILEFFLSQRSKIRAGGILEVVFDNDCRKKVAQGMESGLDFNDLTGNGRMHGSADGCGGIIADLLAHCYIITHSHQGLARCTDVLLKRHNNFLRRSNDDYLFLRSLHIIGMYAATELIGHLHHLSIF